MGEGPGNPRPRGRILYLTDDAELLRRQLDGEDLPYDASLPLRHEISTDEITPGWVCFHHDQTLGEYPYVGLRAGDAFPVGRDEVRRGGFTVSVSGRRRGKGSSREQAPYAEYCAGIRVVVAQSFERIYEQNCIHLGLLPTTDFSVLGRLERGEEIPREVFTAGRDPLQQAVLRRGGLFAFNRARLAGEETPAAPPSGPRAMSLAEKILARHGSPPTAAVRPGDSRFVRCDLRFSHEYVTPMAAALFASHLGPDAVPRDPQGILFFQDHLSHLEAVLPAGEEGERRGALARGLASTQRDFARRWGVRLHGAREGGGSEAICHQLVTERYARPGEVVVGTDSHTPHAGALGCLAFGVGATAMANAWFTGDVLVTVPPTVRIQIDGRLGAGVTAKDLMLEILRRPAVREGKLVGRILEYAGSAVQALPVDERATLTNMAAEAGGFTGIVAPDEVTARWLVEQRGMDPARAGALCADLASDADAVYEEILTVDASRVGPMVARPGDPGRGIPLGELDEVVPVDIAYAGSCTAGKAFDMDLYARVLAPAAARGERVPEGVRFYIQCGSEAVLEHCRAQGYLEVFEAVGAEVLAPGCGACIAAGPGVSTSPGQVTVSAVNRNFPGRSGPGSVWLASPLTVAASALAGRLSAYTPRP